MKYSFYQLHLVEQLLMERSIHWSPAKRQAVAKVLEVLASNLREGFDPLNSQSHLQFPPLSPMVQRSAFTALRRGSFHSPLRSGENWWSRGESNP
jgi:hypothetical protein